MDVSLSNALTATVSPRKPSEPGDRVSTTATSSLRAAGEPQRQLLEEALSNIEGFVQRVSRDLDFSLDDSTGRMVIQVTDRASGDVVRQIPCEEALRLAENLEQVRSLLFKAEA